MRKVIALCLIIAVLTAILAFSGCAAREPYPFEENGVIEAQSGTAHVSMADYLPDAELHVSFERGMEYYTAPLSNTTGLVFRTLTDVPEDDTYGVLELREDGAIGRLTGPYDSTGECWMLPPGETSVDVVGDTYESLPELFTVTTPAGVFSDCICFVLESDVQELELMMFYPPGVGAPIYMIVTFAERGYPESTAALRLQQQAWLDAFTATVYEAWW